MPILKEIIMKAMKPMRVKNKVEFYLESENYSSFALHILENIYLLKRWRRFFQFGVLLWG